MTQHQAPAPCPDHAIPMHIYIQVGEQVGQGKRVCCTCGREGPWVVGRDNAIAAWNARRFVERPVKNHPDVIKGVKAALAALSVLPDEKLAELFSQSLGDVGTFITETSQESE
jgi:hypothetical protein